MGLEPTTPGLGSRKVHRHARPQTDTNACIDEGFRGTEAWNPASLCESILGRLSHYWATSAASSSRTKSAMNSLS